AAAIGWPPHGTRGSGRVQQRLDAADRNIPQGRRANGVVANDHQPRRNGAPVAILYLRQQPQRTGVAEVYLQPATRIERAQSMEVHTRTLPVAEGGTQVRR